MSRFLFCPLVATICELCRKHWPLNEGNGVWNSCMRTMRLVIYSENEKPKSMTFLISQFNNNPRRHLSSRSVQVLPRRLSNFRAIKKSCTSTSWFRNFSYPWPESWRKVKRAPYISYKKILRFSCTLILFQCVLYISLTVAFPFAI